MQPPQKERAIGVVRCKKEGMLLQPLRWCCVDCVIHHERDVREEQHHRYMWREQAITECSWHVNSIVACCHSAKLCAYAARDFRSQQLSLLSNRADSLVTSVPFKGGQLRKCGEVPELSHSEISFLRTCSIPNLISCKSFLQGHPLLVTNFTNLCQHIDK